MSNQHLREIEEVDRSEVCALLADGFPQRTLGYWQTAFDLLTRRLTVEGYPRYGYGLEIDGRLEGVLLLITARIDGIIRSNLSSWYVREPHRKFAAFLFQRTIRAKGTVYLNLTPSPVALPIAQAFGFRPYPGGTLLIDARSALKTPISIVRPLTPQIGSGLDAATRSTTDAHLGYGCRGLLLEDADGLMVALYRIKWHRIKWLGRLIPAAHFVAGDPARLIKASGGLMRALLRRGVPLSLIDAPPDYTPPPGIRLLAWRERRYVKGGTPPAPGDLRETEIALFGP